MHKPREESHGPHTARIPSGRGRFGRSRGGWTRGSYSYWKVGQYTRFSGAEREAQGGCHFAGEHTSIDFQGYLNGAVESGERVVNEILAGLK